MPFILPPRPFPITPPVEAHAAPLTVTDLVMICGGALLAGVLVAIILWLVTRDMGDR